MVIEFHRRNASVVFRPVVMRQVWGGYTLTRKGSTEPMTYPTALGVNCSVFPTEAAARDYLRHLYGDDLVEIDPMG